MDVLFLVAALLASVIGTLAGFGTSTVLLPVALAFFDFRAALILVAFMHLFSDISRLGFFRHGVNERILLRFGLPSVVAAFVGALLVGRLNQEVLEGLLGLFLVLYGVLTFGREKFAIKSTPANMYLGGGLAGFVSGIIGTGGTLMSAFLTAFGLTKGRYIATAAAISLGTGITRIPVYLHGGFLPADYWVYLPVLLVIAVAGSYTASKIVKRIPRQQFRKLVLVAIILAGIKFIWDFVQTEL